MSVIAFGTDHGAITVDGRQIPIPLDTQALQQIAHTTGGDFHTAATTEELTSVYAQLGEQIGYQTTQKDVSRPWLIAGTLIDLIGSAARATHHHPDPLNHRTDHARDSAARRASPARADCGHRRGSPVPERPATSPSPRRLTTPEGQSQCLRLNTR